MESSATSPPGSFWGNLWRRRFPQIMGSYFVVGFTLLQFLDWIVTRYYISPFWIDILLFFLILMLPGVAIVAYNHGKPGKDIWTKTEKVFLPLNIMVALSILFFSFKGAELGASADTIQVEDASGEIIEKVVSKQSFRKTMAIFYFENKGQTNDDWLSEGIPFALELDMDQDLFVNVSSSFDWISALQRNKINEITETPVALQRRLSEQKRYKFFTTGSFERNEDGFSLDYAVFGSPNWKQQKSGTLTSTDIFSLIDQLSIDLKKAMDLGDKHLSNQGDPNISEIYTGSEEAFKQHILGFHEIHVSNNLAGSIPFLLKAVDLYPDFALAHFALTDVYTFTNQKANAQKHIGLTLEKLYALPDEYRILAKAVDYSLKDQPEKSRKTLHTMMEFHPNSLLPINRLGNFYYLNGSFEEAKKIYRRGIEVDPVNENFHIQLANMAMAEEKFDSALIYYQTLAEYYPNDASTIRNFANYYKKTGDLEKALEQYEKSLLLEPEHMPTKISIAKITSYRGDFLTAENMFNSILSDANSLMDKMNAYDAFLKYLQNLGKMNEGADMLKKLHQIMDKQSNPFQAGILKLQSVDFLCEAGRQNEALALVKNVEKTFATGMIPGLASIGYFNFYRQTGNIGEMKKAMDTFEATVNAMGSGESGLSVIKALFYQAEGRWEEALELYKNSQNKVAIFDENSLEILIECAKCCRELAKYDEGIEYLKKVLKEIPYHAKALLEMAKIYYLKDDPIKAEEYGEKALSIWKDADPGFTYRAELETLLDKIKIKG